MPELFTTTSTVPKVFNVSSNSRSTSAPYEGNDRVRRLLEKAMMRPPEVTLFAACANTRNVPRSFVLMALSNTFLAGPDGGWVNSQVLRANGGFAY